MLNGKDTIQKNGLFGKVNNTENYTLITKHNKPPKEYRASSEALLKGVGIIPTLRFFILTEKEDEEENLEYPKELGHYSFILQAFRIMFGEEGVLDESDIRETIHFVKQNKNKIDKLLSRCSILPTYLSAGGDGVVYTIGADRILKIFREEYAYEQALEAMNRVFKGHQLGAIESYIDDAGELGYWNGMPIYYYIQEKMQPVEHLLNETLNLDDLGYFQELLDGILGVMDVNLPVILGLKKMKDSPDLWNAIRAISKRIKDKVENDFPNHIVRIEELLIDKINKNWLNELIEQMIANYMLGRTDLHAGNIGISQTTGKLIFFDAAFRKPGIIQTKRY